MLTRIRTTSAHLLRFFVATTAAVAIAACSSSTDVEEEEPDVATMRILVGGQTINVDASDCDVTGGPITLTAGSTTVSVQFLLANGQPDPVVTAAKFRVDVTPSNAGVVTFARTGAFAGTLTRLTAGQTTVNFALYHLEEAHNEFDCDVSLNAQ